MNFIISLAFWAVLFLVATVSKSFANGEDWVIMWTAMQVITTIVAVIFIIVAVFFHMSLFRESVRIVNRINKLKKRVVLNEEKYSILSAYYQKYLADEYPKLEKEIFNRISDSKPTELVALLQNYPELKTSIGFGDMIKRTSELVEDIYETKKYVDNELEDLDNILTNPWLIWKPKPNV
jgi:hypothetical protein